MVVIREGRDVIEDSKCDVCVRETNLPFVRSPVSPLERHFPLPNWLEV